MSEPALLSSDRPSRERDIELVMVTGAGASREFGVNGVRMPLMGDWSEALLKKLAQRMTYADATGLRRGMSGEEFEAQLGKFLKQVDAFSHIEPILDASVRFGDFGTGTQQMSVQGVMAQWHKNTTLHLGQITDLIHESLYELFADPPIDTGAAAAAYGSLFGALGVGAATRMVYVTTNYDTIGEQAIRDNGGLPDWGQPPTVGNEGELPLRIPGLLAGIGRYVPVLHLYGRVGWYRRDGRVYGANVTRHQSGFGTPVVMLPDPDKAYDQDDVISAMWQQFDEALARAKRVLVLGHSLNDRHLVRALAQNIDPKDRIAITVLADEHDPSQPDRSAAPLVQKALNILHNAAIIPIRFGTSADYSGRVAIETWIKKTG
jgi:hypothetical protein